MPKKVNFSKKEIAEIQKRHEEIVEKMNRYLPDNMKIKPVDMASKLNDSKIANSYYIASELKERNDKQSEIQEKISGTYTNSIKDDTRYPFYAKFKTDGSPESEKYNNQLYSKFTGKDGEKVHYQEFSKLLKTSAKELYALGDDPEKLTEYYRDHYEVCENAHTLLEYMKYNCQDQLNKFTDEFVEQLPSMKGLIELVNYPRQVALNHATIDDLAFPEISKEQAEILSGDFAITNGKLGKRAISIKEDNQLSPKAYFDQFKKYNRKMQDSDEFISKNQAFKNVDGKKVFVPIDEALKSENKGIVKWVVANHKHATFKVDSINDGFREEYLKQWQKTFAAKRIGYNGKFDLNEIEDKHKGGFWERKIKHSTSQEYKNMLQALKDYNNPKSKNYMNDKNLRSAAEAYKQHQKDQGYESGKKLSGTALLRRNLANTIIDTLNDHDKIFDAADKKFNEPLVEEPKIQAEESMGLDNLFNEQVAKDTGLDKDYQEQIKENIKEEKEPENVAINEDDGPAIN